MSMLLVLILFEPRPGYALLDWDPDDLDEPEIVCTPELHVVGEPRLHGYRFAGATVTIDATRVGVLNEDSHCTTYKLYLASFD